MVLRYSSSGRRWINTARDSYGETGVQIAGGAWLVKPQYRWSIKDRAYVRYKKTPASSMFRQAEQPSTIIEGQTPENPGLKTTRFSTYGTPIPASIGSRLIVGNVIDCSDLEPRLVGYREYYTEERVYPEGEYGGPA
jgi:hypothetical protein